MSVGLTVRPVTTTRDWSEFLEFRHRLYRPYSAFTRPLNRMERSLVDPRIHPFYEHADRAGFLCYRGNQIVGRIAAIKDDLHNEYHKDRLGFFGFFESIDDGDVAQALIDTARDWLRDRGCDSMRGPVNPSMKSEFGVQILGHDVPSAIMLAWTPDYYDRLLQETGLAKAMDFHGYLFDKTKYYEQARGEDAKFEESWNRIRRRYPDLTVRDCAPNAIEETLREINRLGNLVRRDVFGFVPLTDSELDFMVAQLRRIIRPEFILCCFWKDRLVGYCVNVPDVNMALRRCWGKSDWIRMPQLLYQIRRVPRSRMLAIGADPEFRNQGAAVLVSMEMRRRGLDAKSFQQIDFSWIAENNIRSIRNVQRMIPLERYKTFRLYDGAID